jgi:hypothetical protein
MKVVIAGSRGINDKNVVNQAIKDSGFKITEILCGCAKGVDSLGRDYGLQNNIPVAEFPANWTKYGNAAGIMRNIVMSKKCDALIAIWDGHSRGTKHMIECVEKLKLPSYVKIIET